MGRPFLRGRGKRVLAAVATGAVLTVVPVSAHVASAASSSSALRVPVFTPALRLVGRVNLTQAAKAQAAFAAHQTRASAPRYRVVDNAVLSRVPRGTLRNRPAFAPSPVTTSNVRGESGFYALGDVQQSSTAGGLQLEPPDQGLCAGGGYVTEFINDALAVYDPNGQQLLPAVGSPALFRQPTTAFLSDPRCYYDAPTQRWFLAEFVLGAVSPKGKLVSPSTEFIDVSETADPTGTYDVYAIDTTDAHRPGCPCFGDYDNLGADANGIYITTDEFGDPGINSYSGSIIYAISKAEIETVRQSSIVPTVFAYRLGSNRFGPTAIVAPTTTPPGALAARNTEYFVESNPNAAADHHLMVYALRDTSLLAQPAPPTLYLTEVGTEAYAQPPAAVQKPGPLPLGRQYQAPEGRLQADFDAAMEPTYRGGLIYAQLDTGSRDGDAVDWFILQPKLSGRTLSVTVANQGRVGVEGANLLYPYTAVNSAGVGYLLFSLMGKSYFPSPAYISYGKDGPTGPIHIARPATAPEDGFTCYSAFVGPNYGGCRWGDYSQGAVMGNRVFMATETVSPAYRDLLNNWSTFIWSAPPVKSAP